MPTTVATPSESINKTFLNRPLAHATYSTFAAALQKLVDNSTNQKQQTEEYHKTLLRDFLNEIGYGTKYSINVSDRIDLAIFESIAADARVSVIFETKKRGNAELCRIKDLNKKALQEALLYYLRERVGKVMEREPNLNIKNIVITDIDNWFVFDSRVFENSFMQDAALTKAFANFERGSLSATRTEAFYAEIAKPAIDRHIDELEYTYFNLSEYVEKGKVKASKELNAVCKFLSPENLLRLPFENIGNSLNEDFYSELLHILGLEEAKTKQKRIIQRKPESERLPGSMLENALQIILGRGLLANVKDLLQYGETLNEQLLSIGLQLCTTWLNRVLFIKLLEGQLVKYDKEGKFQPFLSIDKIKNYRDLEELFFDVLAVEVNRRSDEVLKKYPTVPYLNSSLFEPTELEKQTIQISGLKNNVRVPLFKGTILRNEKGTKLTGELELARYLIEFLESYDFSAVSPQFVLDENKPIINAAVLGLIFEKINNYQDGAFFTPASVTSYICRNTVRRTVVRRVNEILGWKCNNLIDVYNNVTSASYEDVDRIVSTTRICDPAVGSGHFLVAALNELLCVKHELGLLRFPDGKIFKGQITAEGDELIVLDENGEVFEYDRRLPNSQRLQELLFSQKRLLIENCLFGVDLNPTSAHICRLRLWIELLKSSYYKVGGALVDLETLPNIDINIKTGNSLISRFQLAADLKTTIKRKTASAANFSVAAYRKAVHEYTNAHSKEAKKALGDFIAKVKENFREEIKTNDKDYIALGSKREELRTLLNQSALFAGTAAEEVAKQKKIERLDSEIGRFEKKLEELEKAEIYQHAFEWRFEFPDVLDENAHFKGFDAVVGNPPYGVKLAGKTCERLNKSFGKVPDKEIYYWFLLLGRALLKEGGELSYIIPNTIMFNVYARDFRVSLLSDWDVLEIADCTDYPVFSDATVRNVILSLAKSGDSENVPYRDVTTAKSLKDVLDAPIEIKTKADLINFNTNWSLAMKLPEKMVKIIGAIRSKSTPLSEYFPETSQGLIAYDKYQGQTEHTIANRIYHSKKPSALHDKIWLRGEDVRPYSCSWGGEDYFSYSEGVANPRDPKFFVGRRLLIREITNPSIFSAITEDESYNDPSLLIVLDNPASPFPLDAVMGIMNSRLAKFYHFNSSPKATKGAFPKILITDVNTFPLPGVRRGEIPAIAKLAREMAERRRHDSLVDLSALEARMDRLVCDCYGLTEEQKELVLFYGK
ncbi:TaqI-like C-terminal specificity domain-containing protein [Paraburkholderia strydomiana]|uniref:type IIG restriction enzyme/methyltransferase n=1 Tax=Paraburkholderia strydomiana TaxID=1245417 RepID=UPI0038B82B0B